MPFRKNTTPRRLAGKGIPQKFIDQFIEVFNSVFKKTKDEGAAYRQAYGVMNKSLFKAGYRKAKDGKWSKSHEALDTFQIYESRTNKPVTWIEELTLEKALREGFNFEGIAFIDCTVSQLGTGYERYYSPEFNDRCMENTNNFMGLGHVVTMYNTHGSAGGSLFAPGTKNPIGKIKGELWRETSEIRYHGYISPTVEGQDVIRLLYDEVMGESSVRMTEVQSILHGLDSGLDDNDEEGEDYGYIEEMQTARIAGIDLCDQAGITGAGLVKILESAMVFPVWKPEKKEEDMEIKWDELTLEAIVENRKDLLDDHVATALEVVNAQSQTLQESLDTATAVLETVTAERDELQKNTEPTEEAIQQVEALELSLAIEQAAQIGVGKEIAKALKENVSSVEEIPKALVAVREAALVRALSASPGLGIAKGQAKFKKDDEDDTEEDNQDSYTEEQLSLMHLAV